jgi:hypothetical protein
MTVLSEELFCMGDVLEVVAGAGIERSLKPAALSLLRVRGLAAVDDAHEARRRWPASRA